MTSRKFYIGLGTIAVLLCAVAAAQAQSTPDWSGQSGQSWNAPAGNQYALNPQSWAVQRPAVQRPGMWPQACFQQPGARNQQYLSGPLQSFFVTRYYQTRRPHLLARLDTTQGQAVVDLGAVHRAPPLRPGQVVEVAGKWTQVNNRPLFIANCLSTEGHTVQIYHGPAFQRLREIRGDVLSTRVVTASTGRQYRVARVRLDNGRVRLVNLGPLAQISNVSIQPRNRIAALVQPTRIVGEPGFRAYNFQVNGQEVAINWGPAAQFRERQGYRQVGFPSRR